jgi:hypothetical protein
MNVGVHPDGPGGPDSAQRGPHVPRIPDDLLAGYRSTDIRIRVGSEWIPWTRLGEGRTEARREAVFHVITAFNPFSEPRSLEENQAANRELERILVQAGKTHRPAVNRAPGGGWEEPGFLVEGLTREEARELGRRFRQHAVFEMEEKKLRIVACFEDRVFGSDGGNHAGNQADGPATGSGYHT